jgi:XTP/dITP diphosphohydrolase
MDKQEKLKMPTLVIASRNRDKIKEIRAVLAALGDGIEIVSSHDLLPEFDVVEDQDTILGNAAKKALETAVATGLPTLADDTGLFIDALEGAPGVFAARFAGEGCSYADNRQKALQMLSGVDDRRAEFRTAIVLAETQGVVATREAAVSGEITTEERGSNGFGYDAVFEVGETGITYAQMTDSQKNECSHRALALQAILPFLKTYFPNQ